MRHFLKLSSLLAVLCSVALAGAQLQPELQKTLPTEMGASLGKPRTINTRTFEKQINPGFLTRNRVVKNRFENPTGEILPSNGLPLGGMLDVARRPNYKLWPAINATGWSPPDATLGVGPSHVVTTVNSSFAFFTRSGVKQFESTFAAFLGKPAGAFLFDPKVFYDKLSQRFFMIVLEQDTATLLSTMHLLISPSSDPNGSWWWYELDTSWESGTGDTWLDYPGFGYNNDAIVFSGNQFLFAGTPPFKGVRYHILQKAPLLTGGSPGYWTVTDTNAFTMQMAEISDPTMPSLQGIGRFNATNLKWVSIQNPSTAPVVSTGLLPVATQNVPTNYITSPGGRFLDPLDGRLLNASWRDGRMLAAQTLRTAASSDNICRWYELDFSNTPTAAPTVVQSGEVLPPAGQHYWMPAINKNADGDISLLFSRASSPSGMVADMMFSARYSTDPLGAMGLPVLLKSSEGATYGGAGVNRWGDYFQIEVDPIDDTRFWGIAMVGDSVGNWRTHVYDWTIAKISAVTVTPNTVVGGDGTSVSFKVDLGQPAGPSGATVVLSDDNAATSMPSSVFIPSGSSTGTVSVTHSSVASTQNVLLIATLGVDSMSANFTVNPVAAPTVSTLTFDRMTPTGGWTPYPIGTVTLSSAAPTGGTVVNLSSDSASTTVPVSVTVLAGNTTATFTATTFSVPIVTTAKITASTTNSVETKLKVYPPKVAQVYFNPKTVVGGLPNTRTGGVRLNAPAPAGGALVGLTSSSLVSLTSPNVTVPAGATTATFTFTAPTSVGVLTNATVTANYKGVRNGTVKISPPVLSSIETVPTTVVGGSGTTVTATIKVNAPAPAGGLLITLSSNNPGAASMPPSVVIPAGLKSATVTVTHSAVGGNTSVTLKAAFNGVEKTFVLTVTP